MMTMMMNIANLRWLKYLLSTLQIMMLMIMVMTDSLMMIRAIKIITVVMRRGWSDVITKIMMTAP
jgi:glycerol kinase